MQDDRNLTVRSSNPGLNAKTFQGLATPALASERMTLQGTINKSFLLLVVPMASAFWPWSQFAASGDPSVITGSLLVGAIGGFVLALIISFKPTMAPFLSVPYAVCEGLAMGGISAVIEKRYPGIAIQAVALTFTVLGGMLLAYTTRLIRVTERLRSIVVGATVGIVLLYALSWILSLFHVQVPFLNDASPLGIGVSLVIVGIAAFNLLLSFDVIESGVQQGAPRFMEWYGAFGLLLTLVWLYMEILRLLSQVRQR